MPKKNYVLVVIATIFTTIAQLSFKLGSESAEYFGPFPLNATIIAGFFSYGIAALFFLYALRGGELSVLYPIWALSFLWIFLVSALLLKESISVINWFGILFIIFGVSLIGRGARNA